MLTAALIVKNEVKTLEKTVATVLPYVDEVVIGVDTQSTDGTKELAEKLADKVIPIYLSEELSKKGPINGGTDWGFSAARNQVFEECNTLNWRLVLDGHETVHNPEQLQSVVNKAAALGCTGVEVPIHFEPDEYNIPRQVFNQARLMSPKVRYKNPLHNVPVISKTYTSDEIHVEHRKQDQAKEDKEDRDVQRSDSTIMGFIDKVTTNPKDSRSWFYLGTAYKENALYEPAIDAYKEYLKIATWKEERWHARVNMGTCYKLLGQLEDARKQYILAIDEFPAMAEAYYYLGFMAYQNKSYREAQVWLEKCIELGKPMGKLFITPKIYLVDRYDLLSMVYHHLGWWGKAIEQAEKALTSVKNARIEKNVSLWRASLNKHDASYYDELWKKSKGPSYLEKQRLEAMAAELMHCESVLDVGSGPGWLLDFIDPEKHYLGVDISSFCREEIKRKKGSATDSLDNIGNLRFNSCVLVEILEHVEDPKKLLSTIKRYLTVDSLVIASVPRYGAMYDSAHARDYTEQEFVELLSVFGEPVSMGTIGPWLLYKVEVA